jgi:hypothetical protein
MEGCRRSISQSKIDDADELVYSMGQIECVWRYAEDQATDWRNTHSHTRFGFYLLRAHPG